MTRTFPASWPLIVVLAGCQLGGPKPHWSDQLEAAGPCWDVNLGDGIDEESTQEFHDLFACLNRTGNFKSLVELDTVMDSEGRNGEAIGLALIRMMNDLPASELDMFGMLGKFASIIQDHSEDTKLVLKTVVEAMYGRPYDTVVESVELRSDAELDRGMIRPAIPLLADLAAFMLDEEPELPSGIADMLTSDTTDDAICTMVGIFDSEDPVVSAFGETVVQSTAEVWVQLADGSNDLWPEATGNSLRDLAQVALFDQDASGNRAIDALRSPMQTLMLDDEVRDRTRQVLVDAAQDGSLGALPTQLLYLASVDPAGTPLERASAEDISALQAGLRMLDRGNTNMTCTVTIFTFDLDISLGNLSVALLRQLASADHETVASGVGLLGDIIGLPLTQILAQQLADSGYCDPFDRQFLDDLRVVDRFSDPEVGDLVVVLLGLLDAVYEPGVVDRMPETVELLARVNQQGLMPPVEEVLRDTASSQLLEDVFELLPILIDPEPLAVDACPTGAQPLQFEDVWDMLSEALSEAPSTDSVWTELMERVFESEGLWSVIDNGAQLALYDDAYIHGMPDLFIDAIENDPDGEERAAMAELLEQPIEWDPVLAVLEHPDMVAALQRAEPDGPLPFVAWLIVSDTVTVMLQTIRAVLDSLGADTQSDSAD